MLRFKFSRAAFIAAVGVALSSAAQVRAGVINSFDSPSDVVTGPTEAPGVWYPDRFPPAGFSAGQAGGGRTGVLALSIDGTQFQSTPFYNTQGRKFDLPSGTSSLFIDLYVPSGVTGRLGGLWATADDNTNNISAYPIVEYNAGAFRVWNVDDPLGSWIPIAGFSGSNQWYQIGFTDANGELTYFIDGQAVASLADPTTVSLANVILEGYNAGSSYTVFFDNLTTDPVPEPTTLAAFGLVFACGGLYVRRRKIAIV